MFLKPSIFTELNRSHPLARGLVGCWLMNEGAGGKVADLSGNKNDAIDLGTVGWTAGRFGGARSYDGISGVTEAAGCKNLPTTHGSCVLWIKPYIVGSADGVIFELSDDTLNNRIILYIGNTGADLYLYITGAGVGDNVWVKTAVDSELYNNVWQQIVVTWDTVADDYHVYTNTREIMPTDSSSSDNPSGINQLNIASFYDGTVQANMDCDIVFVNNHILSAVEIVSLYKEPFQMFEREQIELWSEATAPWLTQITEDTLVTIG